MARGGLEPPTPRFFRKWWPRVEATQRTPCHQTLPIRLRCRCEALRRETEDYAGAKESNLEHLSALPSRFEKELDPVWTPLRVSKALSTRQNKSICRHFS